MFLSCTVSEIEILVENRHFNRPHPYLVPPLVVTALEFRRDLWQQKTRVPGLSYGVIFVILRLTVWVQYRRDIRTDT